MNSKKKNPKHRLRGSAKIKDNSFAILKNKVLYFLYTNKQPKELVNKLIEINKEKKLESFILNNLKQLHPKLKKENIYFKNTEKANPKIKVPKAVSQIQFDIFKKRVLTQLKTRKIDNSHLIVLNSKLSRDSLLKYIRKFLKNDIPYLEKNGITINQPTKTKGKPKRKLKSIWTRIYYTPMGNKR